MAFFFTHSDAVKHHVNTWTALLQTDRSAVTSTRGGTGWGTKRSEGRTCAELGSPRWRPDTTRLGVPDCRPIDPPWHHPNVGIYGSPMECLGIESAPPVLGGLPGPKTCWGDRFGSPTEAENPSSTIPVRYPTRVLVQVTYIT